jgi:hypothetical protein
MTMANEKKEAKKGKEAKAAEPKKERAPPGLDAKLALGILVVILVAAAAYVYTQQGEKELSLSEFRSLLNSTQNITVVQDLRSVPEGDSTARQNLQNCGVQTVFIFSYLGKNVTSYAYEGSTCVGGSNSGNHTPAECDSEIGAEGRYAIVISYGTEDKTKFYASHAAYAGDSAFLADCAISKIVR